MTDMDPQPAHREHLYRRQRRMAGRVRVAANGQNTRDYAELMENLIAADVAGVKNKLNAIERRVDTRPE